jgi:hypothetical protein
VVQHGERTLAEGGVSHTPVLSSSWGAAVRASFQACSG